MFERRSEMPGRGRRRAWLAAGLTTLLLLGALPVRADSGPAELWFSATPAAHHGEAPGGRPTGSGSNRRGGGAQPGGHGGHESEHRPQPSRTYWLNTCALSPAAEAFVLRPEGQCQDLQAELDEHEVRVTVSTPMGEGPAHGANNVYLIDRRVAEGRLLVATAKWLTIHHNCGWGHDHKFNPARMTAQVAVRAPLEIVVDDLWDKNFHSNVMAGDRLDFRVLTYGQPAPGATVEIESEQGWRKRLRTDRQGFGSVQLVRDYYPESWELFDRTRPGRFKMTAHYESRAEGEYEGIPYAGVRMNTTFAWRYYPARREYVSRALGLLVAALVMVACSFGVFLYRERRTRPYRENSFDEQA